MFRAILEETTTIHENITIDSFVNHVVKIGSLEDALSQLDDENIQFYSDNERIINKTLKKHGINETWNSSEAPGYAGWSGAKDFKFKNIKYKGEIITLEWDPELSTWQPTIRMRSVIHALKYGKKLVDEYKAK